MATQGMGIQTECTTINASTDLLKLFKCTVDIGKEVLTDVLETRVLPSYNGNFAEFLEDQKHNIYHQKEGKNVPSCICPPVGCPVYKISKIGYWVFTRPYSDTGKSEKGHEILRNGRVEQVCLHRYVIQNIQLHELDISLLYMYHILKIGANLSVNEEQALECIKTIRNQICHFCSTTCFNSTDLQDKWETLQKSVEVFTNSCTPSYQRLIKHQIRDIWKNEINNKTATELTCKITELLEELKATQNNNNIIQEEEKTGEYVKEEAHKLQEGQATANQKLDDLMTEQRNMMHIINELRMDIKWSNAKTLKPEINASGVVKECVWWKFEVPVEWNVQKMVATVKHHLKDDTFEVKYVREGSLLIMTSVDAKVLKDQELFEKSVKTFISKLVDVCNIDTYIPRLVHIELNILDTDSVKVIYEIIEEKKEYSNEFTQTEIGNNRNHDQFTQTEVDRNRSNTQFIQTEVDNDRCHDQLTEKERCPECIGKSNGGQKGSKTKYTQTEIFKTDLDKEFQRLRKELELHTWDIVLQRRELDLLRQSQNRELSAVKKKGVSIGSQSKDIEKQGEVNEEKSEKYLEQFK